MRTPVIPKKKRRKNYMNLKESGIEISSSVNLAISRIKYSIPQSKCFKALQIFSSLMNCPFSFINITNECR